MGIVVFLAAMLSGFAYADTRLRSWVESTAEQQLARRLPVADHVEVTVDGFPFTLGVLLGHEVEGVHVRIDRVQGRGLGASELSLDVHRIEIDGSALLREQRLVVTDIGHARVEGFVHDDELATVIGHPIEIDRGEMYTRYEGRRIRLYPTVRDAWLELHVEQPHTEHPMVFPLPPRTMLPCTPKVEQHPGKLRLSCEVDRLPEATRSMLARG